MNTKEAWALVGGLAKPSKMPGWAYGIPAKECKTGKKLRKIKKSTCFGCYALKGCYQFPIVQDAQYRRLNSIKNIRWVEAMAVLINSKKGDIFENCRSCGDYIKGDYRSNFDGRYCQDCL